eukprot:SAG31_NODE_24149_length_488_cov_0.786632_1_plen_147_part_01
MDLDVSDRIIFEDNQIVMTESGIPPHGNSISGYNYLVHPSSRWWSYARNAMRRPPSGYYEKQIWTQRETLTTDGSGWWASGHAESATGTGLILDLNMTAEIEGKANNVLFSHAKLPFFPRRALLTLKVLGGPGTGQTRLVTGWNNST